MKNPMTSEKGDIGKTAERKEKHVHKGEISKPMSQTKRNKRRLFQHPSLTLDNKSSESSMPT